jgi:hypothetical protein
MKKHLYLGFIIGLLLIMTVINFFILGNPFFVYNDFIENDKIVKISFEIISMIFLGSGLLSVILLFFINNPDIKLKD